MTEPFLVCHLPPLEHTYTVGEAAAFLKLGKNTDPVYKAINEGRLLATKQGQSWRIPGGALLKYSYGASLGEQKAVSGDVIAALEGSRGKKAA